MKFRKNIFCIQIYLFLTLYSPLYTAGTHIDSLKSLILTEKNDSVRIHLLNELSYELKEVDANQALMYAQQAITLSQTINTEFGLMRSWGQMGNAYRSLGIFSKAIECYIKGEKIAEKLKDYYRLSSFTHNIGSLYSALKQFEKAKKYLEISIDLDKKNKDDASLAISLNTMGACYLDQEKYDLARKLLLEAASISMKLENKLDAASTYWNLGIIDRNLKKYLTCIHYFEKSVALYLSEGKRERVGVGMRLIAKAHILNNTPNKAIFYYEESLNFAPIISQKELEGNNLLYFIADAYLKNGKIEKAYKTLQTGYLYYESFFSNLDSIKAFERDKAFADMATKYETDKTEKENKIQRLTIENEKAANGRKQTIIYSFVIGLALLAGLFFMVVRSNRITKKANRKIQKQKEQIEIQHDEIAFKNREITSSIEYAKSLQDAILPDKAYINKYLPDNFILWLPRDIVSGDFYWFFEHDQKLFFAAADCTGHGVPGAFVSMTCHNVLNQIVIDQHEDDPGNILHKVHVAISNVFRKEGTLTKANDGMDVALICIEPLKKLISYSGAMNDLVHVSGEELITYKADRYAIGGRTPIDFQFKTKKIEYKIGDWFYMFSDGFKDQFGGPNRKKYMNANFLKLLQSISQHSPEEQYEKLTKELQSWMGKNERIDDVLVVGFKV